METSESMEVYGDANCSEEAAICSLLVQYGMETSVPDGIDAAEETRDELMQAVFKLCFENCYFKNQVRDMSSAWERKLDSAEQSSGEICEEVKRLQNTVDGLNMEVQQQRQTHKAAEDALEHLRQAYFDADSKVHNLGLQLSEAQKKSEQEVKVRDDKYAELDTKFGRLHKRAKQRIQDIQKEKDDLEARFLDTNKMAEQELERSRQHANEALLAMDAERQQLRAANNKFRENIDEMRRDLEVKGNSLQELRQSVFEKEQALQQTLGLLHASEEKKQVLASEFSAKHQKQVESLTAQLADAISDRNKAAESIASLQTILAEKDSELAEFHATSTGEAARLGVALDGVYGELLILKDQHKMERQNWDADCEISKTKLEASENACLRSEIEADKLRYQLELALLAHNKLVLAKDTALAALKDEVTHLENEFTAYKVRAHALLQKKDAELTEAKSSELKSRENAIRETLQELALALAERDMAKITLQNALSDHEKALAARDAALSDSEVHMRNMSMKLERSVSQFSVEKETWQKNLEAIEENWRFKYGALESQQNKYAVDNVEKSLEDLKEQYEKLKDENDTLRDISDRAIEEKEKEIAKLRNEIMVLHQTMNERPIVEHNENKDSVFLKLDSHISNMATSEQQILIFARKQAQREEELARSQRHILALQEEIEELEHENRLHSQQEAMLKAELRNVERSQKREGVDMTYLKNVIVKLLETGEVEALLPVVGTLLQFSPEEIRKCQQAYHSPNNP